LLHPLRLEAVSLFENPFNFPNRLLTVLRAVT
jgi:hypothetical protein